MQVTASGVSAPLNVPVTGDGADFQLSVQGASSSTVTGGSSATYQLLLTPLGGSAGQVTFTCTGAPAGSTCTTNPANVTMTGTGATATIQVTVTTAATSAHSVHGAMERQIRSRGGAGVPGAVAETGMDAIARAVARAVGAGGAMPGVERMRAIDQWGSARPDRVRRQRSGRVHDHGRWGRAGVSHSVTLNLTVE